MAISVHDHHLQKVEVNAVDRTLRLVTAYPERGGPEFVEVEFERVEAYVFRGDALGTILFDIEQVDPLTLYRQYAEEMQQAHRQSGGHASWVRDERSASEFFSSKDVRGYRVSSSVGLDGAVWALDLRRRSLGGEPRSPEVARALQ